MDDDGRLRFGTRRLPGQIAEGAGPTKLGNNSRPDGLNLPPVSEVHRDDLASHGMSIGDALKVVSVENGYDFYVNVDNPYLESERRRNRKEDPRILENQFECSLVLVALLLLNTKQETAKDTNGQVAMTPDEVGRIAITLAPALIPIARVLGRIGVGDVAASSGGIDAQDG